MSMTKTGVVRKAGTKKLETDEELEEFDRRSEKMRKRLAKNAGNRTDRAKNN